MGCLSSKPAVNEAAKVKVGDVSSPVAATSSGAGAASHVAAVANAEEAHAVEPADSEQRRRALQDSAGAAPASAAESAGAAPASAAVSAGAAPADLDSAGAALDLDSALRELHGRVHHRCVLRMRCWLTADTAFGFRRTDALAQRGHASGGAPDAAPSAELLLQLAELHARLVARAGSRG